MITPVSFHFANVYSNRFSKPSRKLIHFHFCGFRISISQSDEKHVLILCSNMILKLLQRNINIFNNCCICSSMKMLKKPERLSLEIKFIRSFTRFHASKNRSMKNVSLQALIRRYVGPPEQFL